MWANAFECPMGINGKWACVLSRNFVLLSVYDAFVCESQIYTVSTFEFVEVGSLLKGKYKQMIIRLSLIQANTIESSNIVCKTYYFLK